MNQHKEAITLITKLRKQAMGNIYLMWHLYHYLFT